MSAVIVYGKSSEPFVKPFANLDDVTLFAVEAPPAQWPVATHVYMRVGETLRRNVCREALRIQRHFEARNATIFNRIETKFVTSRKDICYHFLRANGFRVPWSLTMPTNNEINIAIDCKSLRYPFLLRQMDALNAIGMRLILGEDDLKQSFRELDKARERYMACEFVDTRQGGRGYYEKWRAYVYGSKVDMWESGIARNWRVNLAGSCMYEASTAQQRRVDEHPVRRTIHR